MATANNNSNMDRLPQVNTIVTNGNLGRPLASEDGISGLIAHAVAGTDWALGDVLVFNQLADAEAKGITADYDTTNGVMLYRHIADFFNEASSGATLYVLPVAKTVTIAEMVAKAGDYAPKLLESAGGKIRLLAVTTTIDSFTLIIAAIADAQELAEQAFDRYMPGSILLEGRNCPSDLSALPSLRDPSTGPDSNRVSVVISNDAEITTAEDGYEYYANVCTALGRASAVPVQRNIGRVKDGRLNVTTPALSNGDLIANLSLATLDSVNDKGYIFMRNHVGKAGAFFNGDHCACPINDDYYSLGRGRTIDKAVRIVRAVYVEDLLDDIEIDPSTGKIAPDVIKAYQQKGNAAISVNMMRSGGEEISGRDMFVDPEQDVLATDKVVTRLKIVPKGTVKAIDVELGYSKTV